MHSSASIPGRSWLRMGGEAGLIVLSILLAFAIDASWALYGDRGEELDILGGLEDEFSSNLAQLDSVVRFHRASGVIVDRLLELTEEELLALTPDSLQIFLEAMNRPRGFDPLGARLTGTLSTGRLSLLQDQDLADLLVMWAARLEDIRLDHSRLYDASVDVSRHLAGFGGPFRDTPGLRALQPSDLAAIRRNEDVLEAVRIKLFAGDNYQREASALALLGEDVLQGLRAARN